MLFLELFIQGLLQGSIYALVAVGLTLVYGLLRILHIAHAGLYDLGRLLRCDGIQQYRKPDIECSRYHAECRDF